MNVPRTQRLSVGSGLLALLVVGCQGSPAPVGIPPERVVDFIHTVIEADREVYAERVVHRLQNVEKVVQATEHFEDEKTLPLPAQMLRMGSQVAASKADFRYALISSWAINKANAPKTDFEKAGLEAVAKNPQQPYRGEQVIAGKRYFTAVYADKAVSPACVKCHNEHPESPRKDFTPGDVMGAIVISLPLS
jgi:hypothetical protein